MKIVFHRGLSFEKWASLSFSHQILNIASEMLRAKQGMKEAHLVNTRHSLDRVYELLDLTIEANRSSICLGELVILRESLRPFYLLEKFSNEDILEFLALMRGLIDFDPESHGIKNSLVA